MRVKDIIAEDFVNYRLPSMFIASAFCNWKCCKEQNLPVETCQNSTLAASPIRSVDDREILKAFQNNDITKAVVIGGLEPFDQTAELVGLIDTFRSAGEDCTFVIYTGYTPEELGAVIDLLRSYDYIIIKFGRYRPGDAPHIDPILGVPLASNNQFAARIF